MSEGDSTNDRNKDLNVNNDIIIKKISESMDFNFKLDIIPFNRILRKIPGDDVLNHTHKVIKSLNNIISGDINEIKTLCESDISKESLQFIEGIGRTVADEEIRNMLKLSALYHDLGKMVRKPRHAQQGYYILDVDVFKLYPDEMNILKSYMRKFILDDQIENAYTFLKQIIRYHDLIGTLSTGESSYLLLLSVLNDPPLKFYGDEVNSKKISPFDYYDYLLILTLADMAGTFRIWDDLIKLMIKDREVIFKALKSSNFPLELIRLSANEEHAVERIRRLSDLQIPKDLLRKVLKEKLQEKKEQLPHFFISFSRISCLDYGWKIFNVLNQYASDEDIDLCNHVEATLELLFAIIENYYSFTRNYMIGLELKSLGENPFLRKSIIPLIFQGDEETLKRVSDEVFMWNMGEI